MIFERKELLSVPWSSLDQTAVLLALVLSQVISYLLLPSALQLLHPAGLNLSLLSSNFITLAAATSILMYKVGLSSLIRTSGPFQEFAFHSFTWPWPYRISRLWVSDSRS